MSAYIYFYVTLVEYSFVLLLYIYIWYLLGSIDYADRAIAKLSMALVDDMYLFLAHT